MAKHRFGEGNAGKPKGAVNKVTQEARELFKTIMEGQVPNIESALNEVRANDKGKYLEVLSKLLPYFIPKKLEVDTPGEMVIYVKRKT
jgi:hypothetical protein